MTERTVKDHLAGIAIRGLHAKRNVQELYTELRGVVKALGGNLVAVDDLKKRVLQLEAEVKELKEPLS